MYHCENKSLKKYFYVFITELGKSRICSGIVLFINKVVKLLLKWLQLFRNKLYDEALLRKLKKLISARIL